MPRPQKSRKICSPPLMKGLKPYGMATCVRDSVSLTFEGYESIKLLNYDNLSQDEAAEMMNVSRPTLTRIYNKALKTIARAFVEGKAIEISGGSYVLEQEWYRCNKCHKLIEGLDKHIKCIKCNRFGPEELVRLNTEK